MDFDRKTAAVTAKPGRTVEQGDVEKALAGTEYTVAGFSEGK